MKLKLVEQRTFHSDFRKAQITKTEYEIGNYSFLRRVIIDDNDGSMYVDCDVKCKHTIDYMPTIYVEDDLDNIETNLNGFSIQTTSYGALTVEEIDKLIKGLQEAQEVVRILTETFLKGGE